VRVSTRDPGGLDSCSLSPSSLRANWQYDCARRCSWKNITSPDRRGHWPLVPPHLRHHAGIMSPVMKCTLGDRRSASRRSAEHAALAAFSAAASVAAAAARALPRRSAHPGAPIPRRVVSRSNAAGWRRLRRYWPRDDGGAGAGPGPARCSYLFPRRVPHGGGGRILTQVPWASAWESCAAACWSRRVWS
jgi:hypothetical protein